jgi:hypothetical protein
VRQTQHQDLKRPTLNHSAVLSTTAGKRVLMASVASLRPVASMAKPLVFGIVLDRSRFSFGWLMGKLATCRSNCGPLCTLQMLCARLQI